MSAAADNGSKVVNTESGVDGAQDTSTSDSYRPSQGEPWCSIHKVHPDKCWDIHNPMHAVFVERRKKEAPNDYQEQVARQHLEGQAVLKQCPDCGKYSQDPLHKCKEEHAKS